MFLAYYDYVSITDIVLILTFLTFIVLGYLKGFLTKFISMANSLCGLVFSLLFCKKLSELFSYKIWGESMAAKFASNFRDKNPGITNSSDFLETLGLPSFITNNVDINVDLEALYTRLGRTCASVVSAVISFFILFFGVTLLCFILKLIVAGCRQSKIIHFLDGVLGVVFYLILTYLGVCILFFILSFVMQSDGLNSFQQWIINDFQLQTDKFRLSKVMYENNIIGNFFRLFF